jgi:hypothetical protein
MFEKKAGRLRALVGGMTKGHAIALASAIAVMGLSIHGIVLSERRTWHDITTVSPSDGVSVSVPVGVSLSEVREALKRNGLTMVDDKGTASLDPKLASAVK